MNRRDGRRPRLAEVLQRGRDLARPQLNGGVAGEHHGHMGEPVLAGLGQHGEQLQPDAAEALVEAGVLHRLDLLEGESRLALGQAVAAGRGRPGTRDGSG